MIVLPTSHCTTYTFLFGKVGRMYLFERGSELDNLIVYTFIYLFIHLSDLFLSLILLYFCKGRQFHGRVPRTPVDGFEGVIKSLVKRTPSACLRLLHNRGAL